MAYDEGLAERMRAVLEGRNDIEEKHMFGGIGFLLRGNMACGVHKDWLIIRIGEDRYRESLELPHVRDFDLTGRAMKGWLVVDPPGYDDDGQLEEWMQAGISFAETLPPKQKK
ncbi:MAG: RNA methyltransferase [Spirochaetales bacterium]|nr:RNA methyltransferase [Spirochaetales bacterium]